MSPPYLPRSKGRRKEGGDLGIGPTTRPGRKKRVVILSPTAPPPLSPSFLPAAKPPGHRKVRVVVVVDGDYFEVMTLKTDLRSRSTRPLDPGFLWFDQVSPQGGIRHSLIRFLPFVLNGLLWLCKGEISDCLEDSTDLFHLNSCQCRGSLSTVCSCSPA